MQPIEVKAMRDRPLVEPPNKESAGPMALTVFGSPHTQSDGLGYANGGALPLGVNVRALVTAQRNKVAENPWLAAQNVDKDKD